MADNKIEAKRANKDFNPYPGLRPFDQNESDLFFGRENEAKEVVGKLLKNRFVAVIGESGSGKSSLVSCGVLPKIINFASKESSQRKIISFRPGSDPLGNMADALSEGNSDTRDKNNDRDSTLSQLMGGLEDTSPLLKRFTGESGRSMLLVIDQFEELFRDRINSKTDSSPESVVRFVDFIVHAVNQIGSKVSVIIVLRSDFIGECAYYKGLTQLINNSNYLVPLMGRENFREAIEGPIKFSGAKVDPELVETILDDIADGNDQLPVLQHIMMRTWAHWKKLDAPDLFIGKTDYLSVGTMKDAMSMHADEAYEELDERGKDICEIMFKTITGKGSDNKGLRNPTAVNTIKSIAGCTSEELYEVIEKFRIPSRSFLTPMHNLSLNEKSVIDLSHESLIRLWKRLRGWVDDEAASVRMYLRLSEASALYQQGKAGLMRSPDLQLAINWRDTHNPTLSWAVRYNPAFERAMVYLRTSEKEYLEEEANKARLHKKRMRRIKVIATVLGIASIFSIGFMVFSYVQKITAEKQAILAEKLWIRAEKEKIVTDSVIYFAIKERNTADSIAKVASLKVEDERVQKEISEIKRSEAERVAAEALRKQNMAIEQSDSSNRARIIADQNAQIATEQKLAQLKLRKLALAKALALKSPQMKGQQDLQTLMAYQAYLFNKNNNGPYNDADIYAGLYNVARQYGNPYYKSFDGPNGQLKSIAFIPGKNEFFTSGDDGKILRWSLEGKEQTFQVVYSGDDIIEVLAVSPDASWLAAGSGDAKIKMIPLKENTLGYELSGHKGSIKSLIFSFDGKYLYSAALDGKVLKWDIAARTSTNASDGSVQITSIDISSNGNFLAGVSSDGNVFVWNPERNSDKFRIETTGKNIQVIKFNPDNNLLAIGDVEGNVELWDVNLRRKISEVKAAGSQVNAIQFNTALKQMAIASNDKTLKLFNIIDPTDLTEPPVNFDDNEGFVLVMQFSPDGKFIVSGSFEGSQSLLSRPTHADYLVENICNMVSRNMTQQEWNTYVGRDLPLENTCPDQTYKIKVDQIK